MGILAPLRAWHAQEENTRALACCRRPASFTASKLYDFQPGCAVLLEITSSWKSLFTHLWEGDTFRKAISKNTIMSESICRADADKSKTNKREEFVGPPQPPENWDRCRAYMKRKGRFCRQQITKGNLYCGNHQHLEEQSVSCSFIDNIASKKKFRKRVPCPIDPSQ